MSSATEDATQIRRIILQLFEHAGDGSFKPENAHEFEDLDLELHKQKHSFYAYSMFSKFPPWMVGQDGGQPWFLYWLTNTLELCNVSAIGLTAEQKQACCSYLRQCHNDQEGGFAGSPGLQTHVASTYAAVLAIVNIGTEEAYRIIDVPKLRAYLNRIKNNLGVTHEQASPFNAWVLKDRQSGEIFTHGGASKVLGTLPGSIPIHENGEMDMRGAYCALVAADICGLVENNEEFTGGMGDFIASCQTYEGGISCAPFGEAHGGYTFCGLAALLILGEADKLDLDRCTEWLAQRQISEEGGYNGRINKLIDSCYNFWQGASFELLDIATQGNTNVDGEWVCRQEALQAYTILCCQDVKGGLKDKPTKNADPYHTMYSLAGTSIAQHKSDYARLYADTEEARQFRAVFTGNYGTALPQDSTQEDRDNAEAQMTSLFAGVFENRLRRIHPVYNARYDFVERAKAFYRSQN